MHRQNHAQSAMLFRHSALSSFSACQEKRHRHSLSRGEQRCSGNDKEVLFGSCCRRNTERRGNNVHNVTCLSARCHCTLLLSCCHAIYAHDFKCVLFFFIQLTRLPINGLTFTGATGTPRGTGSEFNRKLVAITIADYIFSVTWSYKIEFFPCACVRVCVDRQARMLLNFGKFDQMVGRVFT